MAKELEIKIEGMTVGKLLYEIRLHLSIMKK
jgi:hypothetical protein